MNEFQKSELIGRTNTKNLFPKYELIESEDEYCAWDFSGKTQHIGADNKTFIMEVKNREVASDRYPEETSFLELDKLHKLSDIANANGIDDIFYLCFYKDIAICYNLRKIDITQVKTYNMVLPHKTKSDFGEVEKLIMELPYSTGKKYRYKKID